MLKVKKQMTYSMRATFSAENSIDVLGEEEFPEVKVDFQVSHCWLI